MHAKKNTTIAIMKRAELCLCLPGGAAGCQRASLKFLPERLHCRILVWLLTNYSQNTGNSIDKQTWKRYVKTWDTMQLDAVLYWFLVHSSVANLITWDRYAAILHPLKPHLHSRKVLARLGWKKYAYQKNWFGTDRFSRVNDFGPSVPDQNFTRARTMSRGSPSTDKTGTRSWKSSPARIKCAV